MLADDIQLPCPECDTLAFTVRLWSDESKTSWAELTCGCTISDEPWLRHLEELEKRRSRIATDVHEDYLRQCPCERCRVGRR